MAARRYWADPIAAPADLQMAGLANLLLAAQCDFAAVLLGGLPLLPAAAMDITASLAWRSSAWRSVAARRKCRE
jgi:hypothetical protein